MRSPEISPELKEPKPTEVNWFFSEYSDENVLEVSKKLLETVKKFVEEAKNQFN